MRVTKLVKPSLVNTSSDGHHLGVHRQRPASDAIHIALVKLPVSSTLRSLGAPDRLHLVPSKRQNQLALVGGDDASEGHRQVVAQGLIRRGCAKGRRRQRAGVRHLLWASSGQPSPGCLRA